MPLILASLHPLLLSSYGPGGFLPPGILVEGGGRSKHRYLVCFYRRPADRGLVSQRFGHFSFSLVATQPSSCL